jgi:hypothetical protein
MPLPLLNTELLSNSTSVESPAPRLSYFDPPTEDCLAWRLNATALADLYQRLKVSSTEEPQTGDIGPRSLGARIWGGLRSIGDPPVESALTPAVREAAEFSDKQLPFRNPRVMFSSDGIVTLQWRRPDMGAALIFAGDGTVVPVVNNASRTYLDSMGEFSLADPLPKQMAEVIDKIERFPKSTR